MCECFSVMWIFCGFFIFLLRISLSSKGCLSKLDIWTADCFFACCLLCGLKLGVDTYATCWLCVFVYIYCADWGEMWCHYHPDSPPLRLKPLIARAGGFVGFKSADLRLKASLWLEDWDRSCFGNITCSVKIPPDSYRLSPLVVFLLWHVIHMIWALNLVEVSLVSMFWLLCLLWWIYYLVCNLGTNNKLIFLLNYTQSNSG